MSNSQQNNRISDDSKAAFSKLLIQHRGIVAKVVHSYCAHPEDRKELSQEIATQLWRSFGTYDRERQFSTWMYRVALNVAISWVRRDSTARSTGRRSDLDVDDIASPQQVADEGLDAIEQLVSQLDPLRRALILLYLEGHTYREIGQVLGISETNVATKINRLKEWVSQQSY